MNAIVEPVKFQPVTKVNAEQKTVTRKHLTQTEKSGDVECEWTFDFAKVSLADMMELASRSVLISRRGTFKKLEKADIEKQKTLTIDVAKYISESGRKPVDKLAVAKKAVGGMTNEEKAALIALLTGEGTDEQEAE